MLIAAPPRVPALAVIAALMQAPVEDAPVEGAPVEDVPVADAPHSDDEASASDAADEFGDLEMPAAEPAEEASVVKLPVLGEVRPNEMSLPVLTVAIAGCDAFNPCAFFVLLSLLGLLIHARSRWKMAIIGGTFVIFSGVFYFVFMTLWLNLFLLTGGLPLITIAAGIVAILAAVINIKDFFWFKQGISLSIPEKAKPGLFERMRRLSAATSLVPMLLGTMTLAAAANSYELLCTSGFPMIFTNVLSSRDLPAASRYGYLALYNVVYVLPLAGIVTAFTYTLGRRKLQEHEGRLLKLLSGVMMLELGVILLAKSELLQRIDVAAGLLAVAVAVTAIAALFDRLRPKPLGRAAPAPRG